VSTPHMTSPRFLTASSVALLTSLCASAAPLAKPKRPARAAMQVKPFATCLIILRLMGCVQRNRFASFGAPVISRPAAYTPARALTSCPGSEPVQGDISFGCRGPRRQVVRASAHAARGVFSSVRRYGALAWAQAVFAPNALDARRKLPSRVH